MLDYDIRFNEGYVNEPRQHPNESNHEDKMTKKDLKKLKITTYTRQEAPSFLVAQLYELCG